MKARLFKDKRIILIITGVLFLIIVFGAPIVNKKIECQRVNLESDRAFEKFATYFPKAKKEWDSFPDYIGEEWFSGQGAKDPGEAGGEIYFSFEYYWRDKYEEKSNREFRVSQRIIVNNPTCFDPRTVSDAQENLKEEFYK